MCVMELFIFILAFVLLVAHWLVGESEVRGKLMMTIIYLLTWTLIFINPWLTIGAQALFSVIVGYKTFGSSFGGRR